MQFKDDATKDEMITDLIEHRVLYAQISFKLKQTYLRAAHYEESLDFTEANIRMLEKKIAEFGKPSLGQTVLKWIRVITKK